MMSAGESPVSGVNGSKPVVCVEVGLTANRAVVAKTICNNSSDDLVLNQTRAILASLDYVAMTKEKSDKEVHIRYPLIFSEAAVAKLAQILEAQRVAQAAEEARFEERSLSLANNKFID